MNPQSKTHRIWLTTEAERLALMLKALGNPVRFQIVQTLAERQTCITQEIVDSMPLAQSTISQHLKVLREAGLVCGETEGSGDLLLPRSPRRALAQGADRSLAARVLRAWAKPGVTRGPFEDDGTTRVAMERERAEGGPLFWR